MILPPTWSLPESVRARVSPTTYGRQRAIFEEGHLLLILHKPPKPNVAAREDIKITDVAPIVRTGANGGELVNRRWSWPAPGGKPAIAWSILAERCCASSMVKAEG